MTLIIYGNAVLPSSLYFGFVDFFLERLQERNNQPIGLPPALLPVLYSPAGSGKSTSKLGGVFTEGGADGFNALGGHGCIIYGIVVGVVNKMMYDCCAQKSPAKAGRKGRLK